MGEKVKGKKEQKKKGQLAGILMERLDTTRQKLRDLVSQVEISIP